MFASDQSLEQKPVSNLMSKTKVGANLYVRPILKIKIMSVKKLLNKERRPLDYFKGYQKRSWERLPVFQPLLFEYVLHVHIFVDWHY